MPLNKCFSPFLFIVLTGGIGLILFLSLCPQNLSQELIQEGGFIENISAAAYVIGAAAALLIGVKQRNHILSCSSFFILLLGLRELDFHDRFTTMGIFKTKYYISNSVPTTEKIIVILFLLCLVTLLILFLKKAMGSFLTDFKQRVPYTITAIFAIACIFCSKGLDSFSGLLEPVISLLHSNPSLIMRIMEESIELCIPLLLGIGIIQHACFFNRQRS